MIRVFGILLVMASSHSFAQYFNKMYGAAWDVNTPLSNSDFISGTSKRGAKIFYREFINERFAVGGELAAVSFKKYDPPRIYGSGTSAIYTDLFEFYDQYSITMSGEYYFIVDRWYMPYAGLGIGASYNQFFLYYNIYSDRAEEWAAVIRPHAGVLLRFGTKSSWGALASVHYDYHTLKNEDYGFDGFSSIGFQVGVVYLNW